MLKIISKYNEFDNNLSTLENYIYFNKNIEGAKYRDYREIVYGSIINRSYTLWETFVKDVFYEYFILNKEKYYKDGTIIERYRLNELPGYLFETAIFNREEEQISFNLDKKIISFTSKNMDMKEMCNLFKRVDLDIRNTLENNIELKEMVSLFELCFEEGLSKENQVTQALKRIIGERNLVSHHAHLDQFQNLDILLEWVKFYKYLGKILCSTLCLKHVNSIEEESRLIGECKKVYTKHNVVLIDTYDNTEIDKKSLIYVYENSEVIDIVRPLSFKVNDNDLEYIIGENQAGIKVESILHNNPKLKDKYEYYIMNINHYESKCLA